MGPGQSWPTRVCVCVCTDFVSPATGGIHLVHMYIYSHYWTSILISQSEEQDEDLGAIWFCVGSLNVCLWPVWLVLYICGVYLFGQLFFPKTKLWLRLFPRTHSLTKQSLFMSHSSLQDDPSWTFFKLSFNSEVVHIIDFQHNIHSSQSWKLIWDVMGQFYFSAIVFMNFIVK